MSEQIASSLLLRRIEKLEAIVRSLNSGGTQKSGKLSDKEKYTWAICRNEDGLDANRVVRIWTRDSDEDDDEDDTRGDLPSCDYIDTENCEYMTKVSFKYGVTMHEVKGEGDQVMILERGDALVEFISDKSEDAEKVKFGDYLYLANSEGKIGGYGDDLVKLPLGVAIESESDKNDYNAIFMRLGYIRTGDVFEVTEAADADHVMKAKCIKRDGDLVEPEFNSYELDS